MYHLIIQCKTEIKTNKSPLGIEYYDITKYKINNKQQNHILLYMIWNVQKKNLQMNKNIDDIDQSKV